MVAVVGLGNLGQPLFDLLKDAGHEVVGCDKRDPDFNLARDTAGVDMVFIVVPTPSLLDGTYDKSAILSVLREIEPGPIIVVVSTVLPGDCDIMARFTGHRIVYSPEFVRLGHVRLDMMAPDFILIGAPDAGTGSNVADVLRAIAVTDPPVVLLSVVEAELAKLAVNTFVTTKISYANMIGEMAEKLGADALRVCGAIGLDHRIGTSYLRPGGAYRGPCFPRDNAALAALARKLGTTADIAEATDRVNQRQTQFFPEDGDRGY